MSNDVYQTPFNSRYAGTWQIQVPRSPQLTAAIRRQRDEEAFLTSDSLFDLAAALALVGRSTEGPELGLPISDEATSQMKAHVNITDEEFEAVAVEEKRRLHDVMAHVHVFGLAAPAAAGIIHLGATTPYCTDNGDLIAMKHGLDLILPSVAGAVAQLCSFAMRYKRLACLGYTHGQPAQPTTVGKRTCLWIQDLLMDLRNLERVRDDLRFRGVKGTTGTQASFLQIFQNDHDKVVQLDELVSKKAGFKTVFAITSQTYSRKVDLDIVNALGSLGATCERIGGDIRHLAMLKEIEEPNESHQIGSSAMAYKRNPMRAERLCSLARYLRNKSKEASDTYAAQWLEMSLDDSAIRRITIPESFLCADACLILLLNITAGLVVHEKVISQRLDAELPFMATENIIMACVKKGLSRQEAHERIRVLSLEAAAQVKELGKANDLVARIRNCDFFDPINDGLDNLLAPATFVGRAPQQVEYFTADRGEVQTALSPYKEHLSRADVPQLHV